MRMAAMTLVAPIGGVLAASPAAAQTAPVKAEVRQDWTEMKDTMMKIAEAMPGDKFSFKPTPAQRSYGEQILHVAGTNVTVLPNIGGKAQPPTVNRNAVAKAEILKALADSFHYGIALSDQP